MGELVEGGSAADIAGCDGGAGAQVGGGDLVEEDAAEVDLSYINIGAASISDIG